MRVERQQQRRDVAEADDRLGVGARRVQVEVRQQARAAPAAARADDAVDARVQKGVAEVGGAVAVGAGEVAEAAQGVRADARLEPERLPALLRAADVGAAHRAGGADEAQVAARREPPRTHERARPAGLRGRRRGGGRGRREAGERRAERSGLDEAAAIHRAAGRGEDKLARGQRAGRAGRARRGATRHAGRRLGQPARCVAPAPFPHRAVAHPSRPAPRAARRARRG